MPDEDKKQGDDKGAPVDKAAPAAKPPIANPPPPPDIDPVLKLTAPKKIDLDL